jgi:hypothetical protein
MCVEHFLLLVVGKLRGNLARAPEWILQSREALDEARPSFEELGQLLDAQLPR